MLLFRAARADVADIIRGAVALGRTSPEAIASLVCDGLSRMIRDEAERRAAMKGGA
ncbi:MAG: hypothetical protein KBD62_37840 [Kofleriaceae bacterium]|nr:hypothetical protein [Kofleriaceae bacterium]